jgi:hypothetical protein
MAVPWASAAIGHHPQHSPLRLSRRARRTFYYDRTSIQHAARADVLVVTKLTPYRSHDDELCFANDEYLCFSIKRAGKRRGLFGHQGVFQAIQLMYVAGDRRLVRSDQNRNEQVSVYRAGAARTSSGCSWISKGHELLARPARMVQRADQQLPGNIRGHTFSHPISIGTGVSLNGHLDELMYERGSIDTSLPFAN